MANFDQSSLITALTSIILPTNTSLLIAPAVSFAGTGGNNVVSVWVYRSNKKNGNADKLDFYINNSASLTNATALGTVYRSKNLSPVADGTGWFQYIYNVPAAFDTAATCYFMIKGTTTNGERVLIDDISISHCNASVSATVSNITCAGNDNGAINLTVNNATAPYSFVWDQMTPSMNPGVGYTEDMNSLAMGDYTVNMTDAVGCSATGTYTISQPQPLSFTVSITNVPCNAVSGSIITTPEGGVEPYSYAWTGPNNFNATTKDITTVPGTYSLTLTDSNGCTSYATNTIGEAIGVSGVLTHNDCYNGTLGSISLQVNGGIAPYTYNWSNNPAAPTDINSGLTAGAYSVTVTDPNGCTGSGTFIIDQPDEITVIDTVKNVSCYGGANGSVKVGVSGGTAPYTYSWNNLATTRNILNLIPGSYSLTVTDAKGCTKNFTYNVTEPAVLNASATQTDVLCNNGNTGAIDLTITGGTAPYTYIWNNNATTQDLANIKAGNYTVTATDANGCTASLSTTIAQPASLTLTGVKTYVSCNGGNDGSIILTAGGGTQPYAFSWSNAATTQNVSGLAAGNYSVTLTDANGCTKGGSYSITQPAILNASASVTNVSCNGGNNGSVNLSANGGVSPYTYLWSNNATTQDISGLTAATYSVTVTDANGCTKSNTSTVTEPTLLTASGVTTNVLCNGASTGAIILTATGGTTPYSYTWNNGSHNKDRSGLTAGTYSVTVTDSKGCSTAVSFTLTQPAAIIASPSIVNVLCNGASTGSIDLSVNGGVSPYTYLWNNNTTAPSLSNLAAGTYSVTIKDSNNCTKPVSYSITQPAAINIAKTVTNVSCNGLSNGSITLNVTGGNGAYLYDWGAGITTQNRTSLAAGNYSVTVTDANNCTKTNASAITEPAVLAVTGITTNILCSGASTGAITLTVAGGTSPYSYSWNTGSTAKDRTGLTAGTYSVTVTDAKGCTALASFTLTQPDALAVTATTANLLCNNNNGGSISLSVAGGVSPYTYLWNGGATTSSRSALAAGTYSVTVKDANNCTSAQSYTLTQPTALTVTGSAVNVSCNGQTNGSVNITPAGGVAPYSYSWTNSATSEDLAAVGAGSYTVTITDANNCTKNGTYTVTQPATLTVSAATTNILCNGSSNGSIILTVTGGTTPYSYSWNNGPTSKDRNNLPAGTYSVTVTDAKGCVATGTYTISEPDAMAVSAAVVNTSCPGANSGSITLTVTGGTAPYTYNWGGGIITANRTNLSAGNYQVTVKDANNCSVTQSYTITQPSTLNVSGTVSNVTCNGGSNGSITLNVTGGAGGYNYAWNNNATSQNLSALAAGTYSVNVTDANNCAYFASYNVTQPSAISVSKTVANVSCNNGSNGSINLSVTGGTSPYNYSWNNNSTTQNQANLTAGTYTVNVADANGCSASNSTTITQPTAVAVTASTTNINCNGGANGAISLSVSGGTSPYTYLWNNNATTASRSALTAGTYSVTIKDANNCSSSQSYTLTQPNALAVTGTATNVSCNNSNNGTITLNVTGGTGSYTYNWGSNITTANRSGLTAGNYSVTVTDANGCSAAASFTISQPGSIVITGNVTNVSCFNGNNGSISVTATGGTGAMAYSWTNNTTTAAISNLVAGGYTVTVTDANGCAKSQLFTVTQPTALTVSGNATNVTCNAGTNGAVNITATGGTSPYSYSWNNNATTQNLSALGAGSYSVVVTDSKGCTANGSYSVSQPAAINAIATTANPTCNAGSNGSITLAVSGGTGAYTYLWNSGATTQNRTSITAGTYSVTIKDANNCTKTGSYTLIQPAAISVASNVTNVSCNGGSNGSCALTVTGGTSPYTYLWNNNTTYASLSGKPAGTYSVTVKDANNCTAAASYTITQPAVLAISTTPTSASCYNCSNGSIVAVVTGGTPACSYNWSNGCSSANPTGLAPGTYTVNVTDSKGCTATKTQTISSLTSNLAGTLTVNPIYTVSPGGQAYTIYTGYGPQSVTLSANPTLGVPPYTYLWSNNATTASISVSPTATTTYTVTIKDATNTTVVKTQQVKVVNVQDGNKVLVCHNGNNTLSVSSNAIPAHLGHGDYLGPCDNSGSRMANTGHDHEDEAIKIYPNPSTGLFTLEVPAEGTTIEILIADIHGKVIAHKTLTENYEHKQQFNFSDLAKGIYLIQVVSEGQVFKDKLIIQ